MEPGQRTIFTTTAIPMSSSKRSLDDEDEEGAYEGSGSSGAGAGSSSSSSSSGKFLYFIVLLNQT